MIKVWICDKDPKLKNFGIVWNVEACMFLRQNYRIVGNLIGTLAKAPKQTLMSGLPLLLSPEECALLVSKNAISLFKFHQPECLSEDYINKFQLYAEMNFQNQTEAFRKQREREIDEMGDKIVEGKLKKIRQSRVIDEEIEIIEEENNGEEQDMDRFKQSVIEEEVSKIPVLSRSNVLFQTFQEQPWISNENEQLESVENIHITNELKYKVFEDLWNKGFYITDGSKFGSDFLAYPGMEFFSNYSN